MEGWGGNSHILLLIGENYPSFKVLSYKMMVIATMITLVMAEMMLQGFE